MLNFMQLMVIWLVMFLGNILFGLIVKFDKSEKKVSKRHETFFFICLFILSSIFLIYCIINEKTFKITYMYILSTVMYLLFIFKRGKRVHMKK